MTLPTAQMLLRSLAMSTQDTRQQLDTAIASARFDAACRLASIGITNASCRLRDAVDRTIATADKVANPSRSGERPAVRPRHSKTG